MDELGSLDRVVVFASSDVYANARSQITSLDDGTPATRPSHGGHGQPLRPVSQHVSVPSRDTRPISRPLKPKPDDAERQSPTPAPDSGATIAHRDVAPDRESDADPEEAHQPREQADPFSSLEAEEKTHKRGSALRILPDETSTDRLEAAVTAGVEALSELESPLKKLPSDADPRAWLEQSQKVRDFAARTKTVIGVVGNTGAGKSSVINAMLDEERLVPTNCMRACTAVVTELSYNHSAGSKYRAEIEFVQEDDWRRELTILFKELIDENGNFSREATNEDSEAGIAYAKIRAVYHEHTKEMLANASVDQLMRIKKVRSVLGTTKTFNQNDPGEFYRRLQGFVDSKEKGTEKLDKIGRNVTFVHREFEYWPLIKVVKIYVKADALSTGAVIVDLPGVHDSNAARAAVAEGYMESCTGLWIVAPINRAVDDKAAKSLLGNTFKRQLKYDGTYSAVTFICSKTDDISRTEAADSLKLKEFDQLNERQDEITHRKTDHKKGLKQLQKRKQEHAEAVEQIDDALETWEDLATEVEDGRTVYAPSAQPSRPSKKRKLNYRQSSSGRKKRRLSEDEEVHSIDSETDDAPVNYPETTGDALDLDRVPLTGNETSAKLENLRQLKKDARRERRGIDDEIDVLSKRLGLLEEEEEEIDAQESALCIRGRNEYSRHAIRQDFADGIRELDQENAEEEDPDNFDPTQDARDYEQVARDLPVFCVSSRAYQKLAGRFKKDPDVPGFENPD
ncbi:hypothetical protein LTR53_015506 [Teratosphaeriaceae sp. CCFEE 6253]|nr:hypothetical protein LTR53_015506 [Teratosphaeriaceae sp. CCFEE 6253]